MPDEYAVYKDGRRIGTARKADPVGDAVGGAAGCLIWLAVLVAVFLVVPLAISLLAPFVTTLPRLLRSREHRSAALVALLSIVLIVPPAVVLFMAVQFHNTSRLDVVLVLICLIVLIWGVTRHNWLRQIRRGIPLLATAYGRGVAGFWHGLLDKIFGGGGSTSTEQVGRGTVEVDVQLIRDLMHAHTAAAGNKLAQDALLEKVAAELRRAGVDSDEASSILHDVLNSSK